MDLDKKHRHVKMAISSSNLKHIHFYTHTHTEWPTYIEHLKQWHSIGKNRIEKYRKIYKQIIYIKVLSSIHF